MRDGFSFGQCLHLPGLCRGQSNVRFAARSVSCHTNVIRSARPPQLEKTAQMSSTVLSSAGVAARTSSTSTTSASVAPTASEKKLNASLHAAHDYSSSESEVEECECAGKGTRILEVSGLQSAFIEGVCCKHCGSGPILFREDVSRRQGLCTFPFLYCLNCTTVLPIPFSTLGSSIDNVLHYLWFI